MEPIKERLNAATPGPWYTFYGGEPNLIGAPREKNNELLAEFWGPSHDGRSPDADFVAHARNHDVRELIHEVERYQRLGKRFVELCRECMDEDEMAPEFRELMYDFERMAE